MTRTAWLLILPVLFAPGPLAAQAAAAPVASGFTVGAGGGLSTESHFLVVQVAHHRPGVDWIARFSNAFEFEVFSSKDDVREFALLRGWRTDVKKGWRRFALGISVDRLSDYTENGSTECGFFGCPVDEEVTWGPGIVGQLDAGRDFGFFGIGVTAQGSLNTARPFGAVGVTLTLGPTSLHR